LTEREPERVTVSSYRLVTDRLERRLFKIDRYRLPLPYGVPLRSLLYAVATLVGIALLSRVPLLGAPLGALPASVRFLALPLLAGFALTRFEVDGRAPHRAALAWFRYRLRRRVLAGLRPAPAVGERLSPVLEIATRPSGAEPEYVPGRIVGPAEVVLGYPCRLEAEGGPRNARRAAPEERLAGARRLRLRRLEGARPLIVGQRIQVPPDRELLIEADEGEG
jgi:hypothetical protein